MKTGTKILIGLAAVTSAFLVYKGIKNYKRNKELAISTDVDFQNLIKKIDNAKK